MVLAKASHTLRLWDDLPAAYLWVRDKTIVPFNSLRRHSATAHTTDTTGANTKTQPRLALTYDKEALAAEAAAVADADDNDSRLRAAASTQLATYTQPPRKDVYVRGAQEWEKNAWKVWDKKKEADEKRRNKYGRAITHYIGGNKLVTREEPPALSQCAHCDIGGGIHQLRRCMGCLSVAYCCRLHQKAHWQWHKHICFAIRAANNLEARKGEGAGWVKLRPRRWRRPPIEKGAVVETNCRMRWANWKQFYTNGAAPMLNMMGDGGPLVCKAWDEAIASMAMCEEATFVFSVQETQRMMMPFVAARKAPIGTVVVIEVGVIDVRRDNGKRREVDDFLWEKNKTEKLQMKADRLEEQKFMRLRERRERAEKADTVQRLLKMSVEPGADVLAPLKAQEGAAAERDAPAEAHDEAEEWQDAPDVDYEAFEEMGDEWDGGCGGAGEDIDGPAWVPPSFEGDDDAALNLPRDEPRTVEQALADAAVVSEPGVSVAQLGAPMTDAPPPPPPAAYQPPPSAEWDCIDSLQTTDPRTRERAVREEPAPPKSSHEPLGTMRELLRGAGLESLWPPLSAAGLVEAAALAAMEPSALQARLHAAGLKMGQRQRVVQLLAR